MARPTLNPQDEEVEMFVEASEQRFSRVGSMHVRTKIGNTSGWTTSSSTPLPDEYCCTSQLHVRAGLKVWAPRRMNAVCFSPFIGRDVTVSPSPLLPPNLRPSTALTSRCSPSRAHHRRRIRGSGLASRG